MKMTPKREDELIAHLRRKTISIPELQSAMNISYGEARGLIEYAMLNNWIKKCRFGNEFPIIETDFERKNLDADACKEIYDKLGYDSLKVLYYLGTRFKANLKNVLENVDDDKRDMEIALDQLLAENLIIKHEGDYYCTVSKKSIKLIRKIEKDIISAHKTDLFELMKQED